MTTSTTLRPSSNARVSAVLGFLTLLATWGVLAQQALPDVPEADRAAALALLQRFHDTAASGKASEAAGCIDAAALLDHALDTGLVSDSIRENRQPFLAGLQRGIEQGLSKSWWSLPDGRVQLRRVEVVSPDRLVVVTFTPRSGGSGSTMRWWLHRRDGAWRIGDFEDLDTGMRSSMVLSVTVSQMSEGVPPEWVSRFQQLMMAAQRLQVEATTAAEVLLADLEDAGFPPMIEGLRRMMLASCRVAEGRTTEALEMIESAESLHLDMPILHYLRAVACNGDGRHQDAADAADRYLQAVGDDPDGLLELATAYQALERLNEARLVYERGLASNPDSQELLLGLFWCVSPDDELDAIAQYLRAAPDPVQAFRTLADDAVDSFDVQRLESLVEAVRPHLSIAPILHYYLGHVENLRDRPGYALTHLRSALKEVTDAADRADVERLLWDCQVQLGQATNAYLEATDREAAFHYMLEECEHPVTASERLRLLEARRADAADDPLVALRLGQTLAELGEDTKAYDVLRAHREAITAEEDFLVEFEDSFIRTCLRIAKVDEALATAQASTDRDDDPFFEVIVYAWKGDVRAVMSAMEVCVEDFGYDPGVFYQDADVGVKLRGPAFKPVREKFPAESSDW